MNEDHISYSNNSKTAVYTPIKIKGRENLAHKNKLFFNKNAVFIYSDYLNQNNKNSIKSNNKYSINEIKERNKSSKTSRIYKMKNFLNDKTNKKERKSFSIKCNLNKSKYNSEKIMNNSEMKKFRSNNNIKEKNLFTYNFVKDSQRVHCSTIIFQNTNKSYNKSNLELENFSNILIDADKSNNFKENKKLKKILFKKKNLNKNITINYLNNNNISKNKDSKIENNNYKKYYINSFNNTKFNLNLKKKLIDSPDSIFYYIYNFINDKKKENNIDQKIYYSKIDIEKKFRFYKKDLEKLEQRTNFEVYYLKRQIIPQKINKRLPNFLSDI